MGNANHPVSKKDFEKFGVIGEGAFGTVVAAREKHAMSRDSKEGKRKEKSLLALKYQSIHKLIVEDIDHAKDAIRELEVLIQLQTTGCPFLMGVRYAFCTDRELVLAMPLLLGGDLRHHLGEYGRFEESRALFYSAEISLGLQAIHSLNIMYRDLKPENIVLTGQGHIRITDFDRSRPIENKQEISEVGEFCGTLGYMAPELINCQHYDQAIDVWSMGVVLYEMLHLERPYNGKVCFQTEGKLTPEHFPCPKFRPGVSEDAKDLMLKMLTFDPKKRIGSKPSDRRVHWSQVKKHSFHSKINWEKLAREAMEPPTLLTLDEKVREVRSMVYKHKKYIRRKKPDKLTDEEMKIARRLKLFDEYKFDYRKAETPRVQRFCSSTSQFTQH